MKRTLTMIPVVVLCAGLASAQQRSGVEIEVRFISVTAAQAAQLEGGDSAARLNDWARRGEAVLLAAPRVRTRNNQEAVCKGVREVLYPTEFAIVGAGSTNRADAAAASGRAWVEPQCFEMREVGAILQVVPEISDDGRVIDLFLNPQLVLEPQWRDVGSESMDAYGNRQKLLMPVPEFPVVAGSTRVSLQPGQAVLVAGGAPLPGSKDFVYITVNAWLVADVP